MEVNLGNIISACVLNSGLGAGNVVQDLGVAGDRFTVIGVPAASGLNKYIPSNKIIDGASGYMTIPYAAGTPKVISIQFSGVAGVITDLQQYVLTLEKFADASLQPVQRIPLQANPERYGINSGVAATNITVAIAFAAAIHASFLLGASDFDATDDGAGELTITAQRADFDFLSILDPASIGATPVVVTPLVFPAGTYAIASAYVPKYADPNVNYTTFLIQWSERSEGGFGTGGQSTNVVGVLVFANGSDEGFDDFKDQLDLAVAGESV